jgi:transcription elongation factor GreB
MELKKELEGWAERRAAGSDAEQARAGALHAARVAELEARIASAVLVEPALQPQDEVRFGAEVRVKNGMGTERAYRIVGVDEADAASGAIAFVAPLARSLLGKRVGDAALVRTPAGEDELEVVAITYRE